LALRGAGSGGELAAGVGAADEVLSGPSDKTAIKAQNAENRMP
jgi:hypothetical protein